MPLLTGWTLDRLVCPSWQDTSPGLRNHSCLLGTLVYVWIKDVVGLQGTQMEILCWIHMVNYSCNEDVIYHNVISDDVRQHEIEGYDHVQLHGYAHWRHQKLYLVCRSSNVPARRQGTSMSRDLPSAIFRELPCTEKRSQKGWRILAEQAEQAGQIREQWSVALPLAYVHKITCGAVLRVEILSPAHSRHEIHSGFWIVACCYLFEPFIQKPQGRRSGSGLPWSLSSSSTACQTVAATLAMSRLAFNADNSSRV